MTVTSDEQAGDAIVEQGSAQESPFGPPETPAQPQQQAPEAGEQPQGEQPAGQEGSPEWVSAMNARFDELRSDLGLMALPPQAQTPQAQQQAAAQANPDFLDQLFPAAPEAGQPGDDQQAQFDPFTGEPLDQGYGPQDQQEAAAQLREYLQEQIQQGVQEQLNPFFETQMRDQRVNAALALEEEFPELRNPEIAQPVVQMAQGLVSEMGMPEAANHPAIAKVVRLIYMASKAGAAASSETPAGQQPSSEVQLETPGARVPGSQQPAPADEGDLIVQAGQGARLPFMT